MTSENGTRSSQGRPPQGRVFGEVADTYDRVRPSHPDEVFDRIATFAGLGDHPRVLEVGAGTGKATRRMVARGWDVTAVEPDPEMARVLRQHHADVEIVEAPFEDADVNGAFDLVCAAQSWHWVDPERGFARAADRLHPGGTLAMWWNLGEGVTGTLHAALEDVYDEHAPGLQHGRWHRLHHGLEDDGEPAVWPEPFGPVTEQEVSWATSYDAETYVALLTTQSDHRLLDEDVRERLLRGVRDVVERHGDGIHLPYLSVIHLARRT